MTLIEEVVALRTRLLAGGFRPVSVTNAKLGDKTSGKAPIDRKWQLEALNDPPPAIKWPVPHALNTGVLCNGLRAVDFDIDDAAVLTQCYQTAIDMLPPGALIRRRKGSPRCLMVFRAAEGEPPNAEAIKGPPGKIEVLGRGHQFVAYGLHWEAMAELEWPDGGPDMVRRIDLPAITEEQVHEFLTACAPILGAKPPGKPNGKDPHVPGDLQADALRIAAALAEIPNDGPADWETWNRVCMAVWAAVGGAEVGRDLILAWSARNPAYDPQETSRRWDHYRTSPPTHIGAGTIFFLAQEARRAREPQPAAPHPEEVFHEGVWQEGLIRNKEGNPKSQVANALQAFRFAPEWQGVLALNGFTGQGVLLKPIPGRPPEDGLPRDVKDVDVTHATEWLQRNAIGVGSQITREALVGVASECEFHPVRHYLHELTWDGTQRINKWLHTYLGAAETPINEAFAAKWLIGLIARVEEPGCKMDTALILEGRQGLRKSSALKTLTDPWFSDHIPELGSKDAQLQLQGIWLLEFADMAAFGKAETNRIKSFLSTPVDRLRVPYGLMAGMYPRQCCFAGTLNPDNAGWVLDTTGARRFWMVLCGVEFKPGQQIDIDSLRRDRDQLWAEAAYRYREGEKWWLDTPGLEQDQRDIADERMEEDAREPRVRDYIAKRSSVRLDEILGHACLNIPVDRWNRALRMDIGHVLLGLKWVRRRVRTTAGPEWRYFPPDNWS